MWKDATNCPGHTVEIDNPPNWRYLLCIGTQYSKQARETLSKQWSFDTNTMVYCNKHNRFLLNIFFREED